MGRRRSTARFRAALRHAPAARCVGPHRCGKVDIKTVLNVNIVMSRIASDQNSVASPRTRYCAIARQNRCPPIMQRQLAVVY
ncbi:hypothetical protein EVAR_21604_1 [Eumeta japonica]|uniref:Uncharacterized protein n=1 Tax=Eumeta variegata TaxID=151549 RepID=A0A4C1UYR2_EUMVA|nr:hypothetical protein EVAR_21604_1 [Eumeta japonica]